MKLFRFGCAVLLVVSMWCTFAAAAEKAKDPFKVVTSEELKALLDSAPATLAVVDVRDAKEFAEGQIAGIT